MKCIICGDSRWKYLFAARDRMFGSPGEFKEFQCTHCGFVRLDPMPPPKELKKYYPSKKYYSYSPKTKPSFFGRLRSFLIVNKFLSLVPAMPKGKPGKIFDIGCGSGDTLALLKIIGWDVYGLDIDSNAIKAAHARGLKNVQLGAYEDLKRYPDNFFDVIRLYHAIEHLDDPQVCIELVYKKLKKGGQVIIGTPNVQSLVAKIFGEYWYNLDAPRHLYLFSPNTLRLLLIEHTFKKIDVSFSSAGGWVGSIQYGIAEKLSKPMDLINRQWLVILFYPFEWVLDRFGSGDVMTVTAVK